MAYTDIAGIPPHYPGGLLTGNNSFGTFSPLAMDADGEKVGFTFPAPRAGTIDRIGFRFATVTQAPTNGLTVSFQGGDGTGLPDGTPTHTRLVEVGSIATNTWVSTGLITTDGTDTGTKKTVTQGEQLYVVIEFASFAASDNIQIAHNHIAFGTLVRANIYSLLFTASWAKQTAGNAFCLAIEYEDDGWVPMPACMPAETNTSVSMNSGSNPNERGMKFTLSGASRATGFLVHKNAGATTGTYTMNLYDSSSNLLATANPDPDVFSVAGSAGISWHPFEDVANVELEANATYRIALKATGAGNVTLNGVTPDVYEQRSALPWGTSAVATSRQGTGAWTDDSTTGLQYFIGLVMDGVGANSGGSTVIVRRFYED